MWTTLISGDLDQDDAVFNSIVEAFKDNLDEANAGYKNYNEENVAYGTRTRLREDYLFLLNLIKNG